MKRVLITGKNSYIGTSVERWLMREPDKYQVDTIDMKDGTWKEKDFSSYDVVFHVAGIAHVSADPELDDLYYKVNRDLVIDTATKAKSEGVKQFIFMSSIIVYGKTGGNGVITHSTMPVPSNSYGDSKLQAEKAIQPLQSDSFKVVVLRPPMIYGKGSKGNYPRLANLAKKTPMFPDIDNQRSMLHIDNLCEFIKAIVDYEESGLFFPQNNEYVKTSELVRLIAEIHGRKIWITRIFNPLIKLIIGRKSVVNKVFGDLVYDYSMSNVLYDYIVWDFQESIFLTEKT